MSKYGKGNVVLLVQKTINDLGFDPFKCSRESHKRVYVQCKRCNEILLREFRKLHQLHACPTHIIKDNNKYKWCNNCEKFLLYEKFHHNNARLDGFAAYCKDCEKIRIREKSKFRIPKYKKSLFSWIKWTCSRKRSECKKHGIKFNLNYEVLLEQWYYQNGKCYYSDVVLVYGENALNSASLERLDPNIGYIEENVVWSSKAMNWMKNNASYNEFIDFLKLINVNSHTAVRCETKLLNDNAKIPERSKSNDAGMDLTSIIDIIIKPNETINISTGVIISAPPGYYFTIEGRSSLFRKGIFPLRGIIDATYTGETMVSLFNGSEIEYKINKGDRIAQLLLHKVICPDIAIVDDFSPVHNQRGTDGYGSTGR